MNMDIPASYAEKLQTVVHEMGHAFGLQHTQDRSSIMYPIEHPEFIPNSNDVQNVRNLFPGAIALNAPPPDASSGGLLSKLGGALSGAVGSVTHFLRDRVGDIFNGVMNPIGGVIDKTFGKPPPEIKGLPKGMFDSVVGKVHDFIVGKADAKDAPGPGGPIGGGAAPAGQINDWIAQALGILHFPANYSAGIYQQIMTESSGNPGAIQGDIGDVNNASGDLAKGIMQVISATFATNHLPGYDNIFNPVDNIIAGSRYAMATYGADWFNPGPRHSHGYDLGGMAFGKGMMVKKTIEPERVLAPRATAAFEQMVAANFEPGSAVAQAASPIGGGKDVTVNVYPPPGQSPEQIATEVKRQLLFEMR